MTCHEARELYSGLLDEALDAGERAALEAHVAGCAECARELERFRRTVSLVRAAAPVRAPAGFVDRVLKAAQPTPWHRRLARRLFRPLAVKLPLEAAALLLVGGAAVYVFQHTPGLQQAARHEAPRAEFPAPPSPSPGAAVPFSARPPATTAPSAPGTAARGDERSSARSLDGQAPGARRPGPTSTDTYSLESGAADKKSEREAGERPAPERRAAPNAVPEQREQQGAEPGVPAQKARAQKAREADADRQSKSVAEGAGGGRAVELSPPDGAGPANRGQTAPESSRDRALPSVLSDAPPAGQPASGAREERPSAPAPPPSAGAPPASALRKSPPAETGAARPASPRDALSRASQAPGPSDARLQAAPRPRQDAARPPAAATADVSARLAVADPELALRGLAELLDRAGGREISRRPGGDAASVDVLVPRERYAEFLRGLAQLGRLSLEREADPLPGLVRVAVRIGG